MTKLAAGNDAPGFELQDQGSHPVRLSDFTGSKLLVYFYPKADTPGCTKQSCAVRDALDELRSRGVAVVGISPDPVSKQVKFDRKHSLGFPLLADPDHRAAEAFGVWDQKSMYGKVFMGINRSAFLIDEDGKIIEAWYKVRPGDTVPNALSALEA
ncbi:MAG: thioredoxin-dependent thiol peroxidase [Actinomycetota bacterium]